MSEKEMLYDEISRTLTEYEEFDDKGNDSMDYIDWADSLYQMLVKVQNSWETIITAE